jgi:thiol:disulfide interchange protein
MAKKEKTLIQTKKSYKRWGRVCFFSEFLSVAAPFVAVGLANYEKYFIEYDGTKVTIGFIMAMAVMGSAIWLISKKEIANSMITLFIGWGVVTGILFCIEQLLQDLCYIMLFGWVGMAGALGLDIGKKKLYEKSDKLGKAIETAENELNVERYKEEKASQDIKKIKVKVKK